MVNASRLHRDAKQSDPHYFFDREILNYIKFKYFFFCLLGM